MDIMLSRILECMGPTHGAGKALADYLGVSPNVVTNWKNGSLKSYRKYIEQIAEFYHVPVSYLKGETGKKKTSRRKAMRFRMMILSLLYLAAGLLRMPSMRKSSNLFAL